MTRDDIILLAKDIAKSLHDPDTLDTYTNDIFHELAALPTHHMVEAVIKSLTSGTAEYAFESDMLHIIHAIMHDELLSPSDEKSLDAYSDEWQTDTGTPTQYTEDQITARTYKLYPIPNFTSSPLIPTHGAPWGEDWPTNSLALIYADDREDNILPIYSLPISFDALAREFSYPSDHTDEAFAFICQNVSQLFYRFIGVINAS